MRRRTLARKEKMMLNTETLTFHAPNNKYIKKALSD